MSLSEKVIVEELHRELEEAGKRGHSGQITVTVELNQGCIARAEINRGRPIKAAPKPGGN